jgi:hypothetical protein
MLLYLRLPLTQKSERNHNQVFPFIFLHCFFILSSRNHQSSHHHSLSQTHLVSKYASKALGLAHWRFYADLGGKFIEIQSLSLRQFKLSPQWMQLLLIPVVLLLVAFPAHHPRKRPCLIIKQFGGESFGGLDGLKVLVVEVDQLRTLVLFHRLYLQNYPLHC